MNNKYNPNLYYQCIKHVLSKNEGKKLTKEIVNQIEETYNSVKTARDI